MDFSSKFSFFPPGPKIVTVGIPFPAPSVEILKSARSPTRTP
jgi:hypothetical protein